MTHRHKNQTDEYERRKVYCKMGVGCDEAEAYGQPEQCGRPTDSNHGSRTDSTSKGGKA